MIIVTLGLVVVGDRHTSVDNVELSPGEHVQPARQEFGVKGNVKSSVLRVDLAVG